MFGTILTVLQLRRYDMFFHVSNSDKIKWALCYYVHRAELHVWISVTHIHQQILMGYNSYFSLSLSLRHNIFCDKSFCIRDYAILYILYVLYILRV